MIKLSFSKIALGLAAMTLSTGIWASVGNAFWKPVNATVDNTVETTDEIISNFDVLGVRHAMSGPDYLVTDMESGVVRELDGVDKGRVVSHHGGMTMDEEEMMGDKITNTRTNRSGIITGISDQGTMEVQRPNGKVLRYQYVTFKVKPAK
ncbi:MAG: hypothetical protein P1U74_00825 [Legionellaceae bacterium]|nr:hypothetical protein [Legionellaceae bacterium]